MKLKQICAKEDELIEEIAQPKNFNTRVHIKYNKVLIGNNQTKRNSSFYFSLFLFKILAILSQQAVSNINVSQQSFSSLFFFFFFYLRKCLSCRAEACNKVHLLIYHWWNRILSVSLFLFWIRIIPIFRKGRRKTV